VQGMGTDRKRDTGGIERYRGKERGIKGEIKGGIEGGIKEWVIQNRGRKYREDKSSDREMNGEK
jgi:hypothetical protein